MIEALMESPFFGVEDREDLRGQSGWVTTRKCDLCGGSFPMYCDIEKYCYQVRIKVKRETRKRLIFCSYHCLRKFQRDQVEITQKLQDEPPKERWRGNREAALRRKAYCKAKLKDFEEIRDSARSPYDRHIAQCSVYNWRFRLKEVEAFLKEGEK